VIENPDASTEGADLSLGDNRTLDHAVWASLTGQHAHFAQAHGRAVRYPVDVAPFGAISPDADQSVWGDLSALVGPGATVPVMACDVPLAEDWKVVDVVDCVQMVDVDLEAEDHPAVVRLGAGDVDEMLGLVKRTQPGPFLPRTIELGTYLGIRRSGALVAMAGQRLHPPGWTEVSAVCTDAAYRGHGLATLLTRAVAADMRARGEKPFLHAAESNTNAIRLYESLGFAMRRRVRIDILRAPG
jgi:ribosomal protein S18 acetylase RimI-like enzyme